MSNPWSKSFEDLRNSIDEAATSYLEKDMKKRQKNNEKARKDMEKMGSMKNPHFGSGPTGSMSSEEVEAVGEALTGERLKKAIKKPGGTAYTRKVSADPAKRATRGGRGGESDFGAGDRGSGSKAARRAGTYQEEEYIDEDSRRMSNKQHTKRVRSNIKVFGSNYTPPSNYDPDANRGQGEVLTRKQIEKKRRKALRQEEVEVDEAMSNYDRARKRAAQRAAERNAARAAGKTGVVPGVGYVSPRKERETYVDSSGVTRHKSGAKMEALDPVGHEDKDIDNDGDHDKSDKYLLKRRKAIGKAMKTRKEDWRSSLGFIDEAGCSDDEDKKDMKKIGKGEVKNKVTVMPNVKMGKQNEEVEVDEQMTGHGKRLDTYYHYDMQDNDKKSGDIKNRTIKGKKPSGVVKKEEKDPCWDTHKQVGMKKKGGKMVPNCVSKTKSEELDFYLDYSQSGSLFQRIKEASWDMKTGKPKDPKKRAEAEKLAADMRERDKRAGRRTYGSAKLGYDKKDWDE